LADVKRGWMGIMGGMWISGGRKLLRRVNKIPPLLWEGREGSLRQRHDDDVAAVCGPWGVAEL